MTIDLPRWSAPLLGLAAGVLLGLMLGQPGLAQVVLLAAGVGAMFAAGRAAGSGWPRNLTVLALAMVGFVPLAAT